MSAFDAQMVKVVVGRRCLQTGRRTERARDSVNLCNNAQIAAPLHGKRPGVPAMARFTLVQVLEACALYASCGIFQTESAPGACLVKLKGKVHAGEHQADGKHYVRRHMCRFERLQVVLMGRTTVSKSLTVMAEVRNKVAPTHAGQTLDASRGG